MSGHSRWSTIRRKKGKADAERGKIFAKLIKEITISARVGGGDPGGNPRLRSAIAAAKDANMPQSNIDKAIKRGTGELPGVSYEEYMYEGYGPGGVAVMVEVLTDNKNRTTAEVRHLLVRGNGHMGEAGCVAWMFEQKGVIVVDKKVCDEDSLLGVVLDAGAEDVGSEDDAFEVITAPGDLESVREALTQASIPMITAGLDRIPQSLVKIGERKEAEQVLRLMDLLEDHDDVRKVYGNFDIPDEIMEEIGSEV